MNLADQIIKQLYFCVYLSVSELSVLTKKSIPKVTDEVNKLVDGGSLVEVGFAASTGGRRAMQYALRLENLPHIVTIAIDQHFTTVAIVDFKNDFVVEPHQIASDLYDSEDTLLRIVELVQRLLRQVPKERPFVVGLTMPGFVDHEKGVNRSFAPESPYYAIKKYLEKTLGLPVQIANDSSAIAIAEHKFGKGKGSQDVLVVNLNWGVGLGMIIENHLYKGHSGYAGEFSHIPLANAQRLCSCGKKGCLEVEASLACALDYVHTFLQAEEPSGLQVVWARKGRIELTDLVRAFDAGDQVAIKAVKKMTHMLGKGLATLIHIMNPEKIIISGNGAAFGEGLLPTIQAALQEYCIPRLARFTEVLVSDIAYVQAISTACIAVQQINMYQFQHKQIKLQQL